ncbi:hypothetical protein ACFW5I_31250 [Streptomyces sp. NPDC058818]|uniref:hypothetical protein n=1 Tax=Streptomyces sp. NPDC058818 TaxID=3346640 RepID=UPI0036CA6267
MSTGRHHLTLVSADRPLMHGWWASETGGRAKFTSWVGSHGDRPRTHLTLTDKATSTVLTQWPDSR